MKTSTPENTSIVKSILALFILAGIAATATVERSRVDQPAGVQPIPVYSPIDLVNK